MEKVMDLKSKVQTSDEGMKHLLRQRRRLEEDDKTARAEMKADARTCRRSLREERRHGVDVTGLPIRPQTAEKLAERSAAGSRRSRNDCDLLKALVEDQLKTKRRIIHRLEKEMKTLSSHRVQEEECEEKHEAMEKQRDEAAMRKNVEELQSAISQTRERRQEISVLAEKHRASRREVALLSTTSFLQNLQPRHLTNISVIQVSSRDRAVEKQQGVQEEMGLQEAEVSRLNEKVRKQQADLQELRETCRHGNTRLDQEVQKTQQLHTQLQLTQRQLQVEAERTERLRGEASSSRLLHAADAERWTRGNLLLQAEIQQLQDQNVQRTQMLGEVEEKLGDAREKIREYEVKRDVEIGLLTRQLEEIRDEAERSRTSSQCHRSAVEIFRQKYTTAMETLRETQVQTRRAEEEAELTGKQLLEARAEACSLRWEMSILETRYEQTERRAALTQILADDLQVALDLLKTRDTERNLQLQEEMEKLRVRTNRQQKEAEAETAQVKSQLRDALLLLQTTRKEVQELREEMQREEVKENEVTRHKLQQMRHRLQELLIFFTDTDDAELRQEDEETEVQPSDDPDENEDVCRISQLLRTVNKLKSKAGLFLRKAVEQGETQRILVSEAAGERDEAREQHLGS